MAVTRRRRGAGALMSVLASSSRASTYDPPCSQGLAGMGARAGSSCRRHGEALVLVFESLAYFGGLT